MKQPVLVIVIILSVLVVGSAFWRILFPADSLPQPVLDNTAPFDISGQDISEGTTTPIR